MELEKITLKKFLEINQSHIDKVQKEITYLFNETKKIDKITKDVLSCHNEGYNINFYYYKINNKLSYKVII